MFREAHKLYKPRQLGWEKEEEGKEGNSVIEGKKTKTGVLKRRKIRYVFQ